MTTPIKVVLQTGYAQPRFTIKRGDTSPFLIAQLVNANGPLNLTGSTVTLRFWPSSCCSLPPASEVREGVCTLFNAIRGTVIYQWQPGDTAESGVFEMEFQVESLSGARFTAPNDGTLELVIVDHP
jgi:hypothetical protein